MQAYYINGGGKRRPKSLGEYFLNNNFDLSCFSEKVLFSWRPSKSAVLHCTFLSLERTDHLVSRPCIDKITSTASSSSDNSYVRLVSNMSGES